MGGVPASAGKQPDRGFALEAAPVLPQSFQKLWAEHEVAVLAAFPALNMDHHALTVDVRDLQMCQFRATDTGGIERHQQDALERRAGSFDEPGYFLLTENGRQPQNLLRVWRQFRAPRLLQRSDVEEPQCPEPLCDAVGRQFSFAEQICLVLADVIGTELIRRTVEIPSKVLHRTQVSPSGRRGVISTLEFLQHHVS